MKYRLLGPVEVAAEDGPVALGGPKPRAVLAVLLLNANRPVSTERLAVALWGEDAPAGAAKTVQVHVSRLRKALPDADVVTTTPAGYQLTVQPASSTSTASSSFSTTAAARCEPAIPTRRAPRCDEALALWRGDHALADVAFEPFAAPEINRLEDERLAALETRADAELAAGRHAALVGELQRLVAAHPSRERFAGAADARPLPLGPPDGGAGGLSRGACARSSSTAASSRARSCGGCTKRSSGRTSRCARLRRWSYLPSSTPPPRRRWRGEPPSSRGWRRLGSRHARGRDRSSTLTGERGIGKTRLAAELAGEVHRHGAAVLYATGAGPPATVRAMFARAREATDPLLAVVDDADRLTPDLRAELEQLAASLAGLPVLVVAGARDDAAARARERPCAAGARAARRRGGRGGRRHLRARATAGRPARAVRCSRRAAGCPRRVHEVASDWARREAARRVERGGRAGGQRARPSCARWRPSSPAA